MSLGSRGSLVPMRRGHGLARMSRIGVRSTPLCSSYGRLSIGVIRIKGEPILGQHAYRLPVTSRDRLANLIKEAINLLL